MKCDKCNKNITKTNHGVECNHCEKIVHLTTSCAGLTNKQLAALRATENLEWTCRECHDNSPKRRSIVVPDDDEDDEFLHGNSTGNLQIDVKQLLKDIAKDVEKTIKRELQDMTQSLQVHSDLMQDALIRIDEMKETVLELKKKNVELSNKNNHLQTRVGALEQRIQIFEQQKLSRYLDIHYIPTCKDENPLQIAHAVAKKLNQGTTDIEQAQRMPGKQDNPGPIQVILKTEQAQEKWLDTFKQQQKSKVQIKLSDIIASDNTLGTSGIGHAKDQNIVVRETLTPYNKHLLWYTKQEISDTYKYIWIKKGFLRVRKDGQENKPIIIRSEEDVKNLK